MGYSPSNHLQGTGTALCVQLGGVHRDSFHVACATTGAILPSAHQEYMLLWRIPGLGLLRRKKGTLQAQQREKRIRIDDKGIDGISMENNHLQLPQRHTSRVIMYIGSQRGDRVSLFIETREHLNPTGFRRPTVVMPNGPDGRVTSDSHSRTTGVNLQGGSRLPATTAPGRKCLNGKDRNGPPRLEEPCEDQSMKVIEIGICGIYTMVRAGPVTQLKAIARGQSPLILILKMIE